MSESAKSSMASHPGDPVNVIKSIRPGSNTLPHAPLPGHGDVYTEEDDRAACGEDSMVFFCADHGHSHTKSATCDRWECPRCWKSAVLDRATKITARLMHYRDKYSHSDEKKLHRVIISPPQDQEFETVANAVDRFYQVAGDLLKAGGATDGGVRILHEYRHKDETELNPDTDDELLALVSDSNDSRGLWPETLPDWTEDYTPDMSETRDVLSHEPHFHCYIVAEFFHLPTAEIFEETDWFIRRLEPYEDSSVSCFGIDDLARSVMYALSHASNLENSKNYRYFGTLSNESPTESQKRRASEICRKYAPQLLGLPEHAVSCKEHLDEEEEKVTHTHLGSSDDDEVGEEEEDSEEWCNAELVHIRSLPAYLPAEEWPDDRVERLKTIYEEQFGEPPPID